MSERAGEQKPTMPLAKAHTFHSPIRHHMRTYSLPPQEVKVTLDAAVQYDDEEGGQGIRINQYMIKQEIGRGSFGAVHLAVDQEGQEYAMKEFSKARLRKRAQSTILRRPHLARRKAMQGSLNFPLQRRTASEIHQEEENGNPLYLVREEIAIMKKLDHENIVRLIEVLDDPDGDSLYMVMEMCTKGVVMKIGLDEVARPYPEEQCRLWFRDLILGIEYLHAQGIIHRDIKPDNLLLTHDDVLKIVDFGVSEMFARDTQMMTAKTAGSPAFLPPELCKAGHGDVSGTAADIWAMGVTLYCLCFGKLPFNHQNIIELCDAVIRDEPYLPEEMEPNLKDLFKRILDKEPSTRIKMPELREHPWVTKSGEDTLLSYEENTAVIIPLPTKEEVEGAITRRIRDIMTFVKAVHKLKRLTAKHISKFKAYPSAGSHPTTPPLGDPNYPPRSKTYPAGDSEGNASYQGQIGDNMISMKSLAKALPVRMDSAVAFDPGQVDGNMEGGPGIEGAAEVVIDGQPVLALRMTGKGGGDDEERPVTFEISESPTNAAERIFEEAYEEGSKGCEKVWR